MKDQHSQKDSPNNTENRSKTSSRGNLIAMQPLQKKAGEDRRAFAKRAAKEFVNGLEEMRARQGNLKMPRPPGV